MFRLLYLRERHLHSYLNQTGGFVRNGIVYIWNSKGTTLFFAVATVGIIIRIFWDIVQQRISKEKLLMPLKIALEMEP